MISLYGFFEFFYEAVVDWPLSYVVGLVSGYFFFQLSRRPRTDFGAALWLVLLVLSPYIGVSTWLIRTDCFGIRANVFLYGLSTVVLISYLIRDKLMNRKDESGESAGPIIS